LVSIGLSSAIQPALPWGVLPACCGHELLADEQATPRLSGDRLIEIEVNTTPGFSGSLCPNTSRWFGFSFFLLVAAFHLALMNSPSGSEDGIKNSRTQPQSIFLKIRFSQSWRWAISIQLYPCFGGNVNSIEIKL